MSTTITVTSAAELNQALSQATGGETILLAAGDYGKLVLRNTQFASDVTIKSADPNAMASFSEVFLNNASNVTFDEINFDYTYASGHRDHTSPFQISYSSNITIDNSVFDGDYTSGTGTSADGTGVGRGLLIQGSSGIDVINTEFHSWWKALSAAQSTDINFIGNNIHTIRSDGIVLGEVQNVLIENNYIHDFGGAAGSGDHRDMIQIQRASGPGSSDIIIRNNVLDIGAGDYTQGIWAGGDKADFRDPTHWNYNIAVENNVLYNAHANGIVLHLTDGATVSNNTVVAVPTQQTGGVTIPKIIVAGPNATIQNNVAPAILGYTGQSHWTVQNNVITQTTDPSAPGYYDAQFVYHATSATDGYNQYGVIPGSAVDLQNAGSSLVDGYPFSYDNWVGSSSTPVNPGGSGTGNTGSTPPGNGTSNPSTPDTGTSNPDAPDTDTSNPDAPDTDTSNPDTETSNPETPDTDTSNPEAPDTGTSGPETPDTETSNPDTETSNPETPDTDTSAEDPGIPGDNWLSYLLSRMSEGERAQRSASIDVEAGQPEAGDSPASAPDTEASAPTGSQPSMVFDDFVLDIGGLPQNDQVKLKDDAHVVDAETGAAVHFDGHKDKVKIGRLEQFEDSDQLAFTVEFARDEADGASQRLVWNKGHVGLTLVGDGLKAHVGNNDGKFGKGFLVEDLGLNDTETHEITLMVDQVEDRLQVLVDDEVVLDRTDIDLDFTGGRERGWDIGVSRKHYADGDLSGFAIDDEVQFVDTMGGSVDLMG